LPPGSPLFQGRQAQIDSIQKTVRREEVDGYHLIFGSRQSGKTTLLQQLDWLFRSSGVRVCRLDLQLLHCASHEEVLVILAKRLLEVLPGPSGQPRTFEGFPLKGLEFDTWLGTLGISGPFVLLLDELGALTPEVRERLAMTLRGIFSERRDLGLQRFLVVVFGGIELYQQDQSVSASNSPFGNVCFESYLPDLSEGEVRCLFSAGLRECEKAIEPEQLENLSRAVYRHTAGHPLLTQWFGRYAFDTMQDRQTLPNDDEIEQLARRVVSGTAADMSYLPRLFRGVEKYELTDTVSGLLRGKCLSGDSRQGKQLELLGVVRVVEAMCTFRNALIERAFRRFYGESPGGGSDSSSALELAGKSGQEIQHSTDDRPRVNALNALEPTAKSGHGIDYSNDDRPGVFISYARKDNSSRDPKKRWLDRFLEILTPFTRRFDFQIWTDVALKIGDPWHLDIQGQLTCVQAAVLLVSPAFLASEYVIGNELPVLCAARARMYPILISPSAYDQLEISAQDATGASVAWKMKDVQLANPPGETLMDMSEAGQNRVMLKVAKELAYYFQKLRQPPL